MEGTVLAEEGGSVGREESVSGLERVETCAMLRELGKAVACT